MTTFYVSATGNDAANGLTSGTAWKSVSKADLAVRPGDKVIVSGAFVGQALAPRASGTPTAPITYMAPERGGASFDGVGLVGTTPYVCYFGARSYIVVDGVKFKNTNYKTAPVTNKGVVFRSSNHITLRKCELEHMQVQLIGSSDNTLEDIKGREFVASYVNGQPQTTGDMVTYMLGSHRNTFQRLDLKYAGHSLIQAGNGSGPLDVNAANVIQDCPNLSNPWYKCLILSDDGAGTVVQRVRLLDANSVPSLYSTIPGQVGQLQTSSEAVQFSGRNFKLVDFEIVNAVGTYGVITLGARWYVDANHPNGVLVESIDNEIERGQVHDNHGAAGVSFIEFLSQADINAGRTAVPKLTANEIHDCTFANNYGTPYSWNKQNAYSTFLYHSVAMAPPWKGYNGNKVYTNQFDGGTANLNDVTYNGKTTHVTQTLAQFEASAPTDVYGNT